MSLAKCDRPQLAAVLAALTDCREHEEQPSFWLSLDGCRLGLVASDGAWFDAPRQPRAPEGRSVRRRWITSDPAEAWERLQARDIIPLDYRGRFVCGSCDGTGIFPVRSDGTRGGWLCACHEEALPHPGTLPDLVAWSSLGFAARDDGSPGILATEEMARASQPCPFVWKVETEPKWWPTINTANAARLRASGLSWWAQGGHVVIAAPPL